MKNKFLKYSNLLFNPRIINYYGIKLIVQDKLISQHIRKIIYGYSYEKQEILILSHVLKKDDIIMEIGAGIGFLSIYCAKLNNNKVVAYEANPELINLIKKNYLLNQVSPQIKNFILSDREGLVDFYIEPNFYSSSIVKRSASSQKVEIETRDINKEIKKYNISFLIIDIEGGEQKLIYNIDFNKNKVNKVLIELHPHVIGDNETNKIIKFLMKNNFLLDVSLSGEYVYFFYRKNVWY